MYALNFRSKPFESELIVAAVVVVLKKLQVVIPGMRRRPWLGTWKPLL